MTIEEALKDMLFQRGLSQADSAAIVDKAKTEPDMQPMRGRWQEDSAEYPPDFMITIWFSVKDVALAYIDEHCPGAWYRPLFARDT